MKGELVEWLTPVKTKTILNYLKNKVRIIHYEHKSNNNIF